MRRAPGIRCSCIGIAVGVLSLAAAGVTASPFSVETGISGASTGGPILSVSFRIPDLHYLYADSIGIDVQPGSSLELRDMPPPKKKHDPITNADREIYARDFTARYAVHGGSDRLDVTVRYQGCSGEICFFPVRTNFILSVSGGGESPASTAAVEQTVSGSRDGSDAAPASWRALAGAFRVGGRQGGYLPRAAFLSFLRDAQQGETGNADRLQSLFHRQGIGVWLAVLFVLLGGLSLNLTPCVLPMIPINIAILGAGAGSRSRARGFALGGVYGLAIAVAYGALGLVVVLTGSKFGALSSSPLFNAAMAVIFVVLALAMFDVLTIDLSRFQAQTSAPAGRGSLAVSFVMGTVAALLAGACVAPVVISVLVLSTSLYGKGNPMGLILPFLLGAGMGLPWPFLGAGLSLLPKPGRWMERIKHAFGVAILGFALYYARLSYSLFRDQRPQSRLAVERAQTESQERGWMSSMPAALQLALETRRPVLIDFWASWCKNCLVMDRTTLRDPEVVARLEPFVKVKFRAEDLSDPQTRAALDYFGTVGLPTYVVLLPHE